VAEQRPGRLNRIVAGALAAAVALSVAVAAALWEGEAPPSPASPDVAALDTQPTWPFIVPQPVTTSLDRTTKHTLRGGTKQYTLAQIDDVKAPPDWFPASHPTPPEPVVRGREGMAWACGSCHLMSGIGHPESANLAALPAAYILRQMKDFQSGARTHRFVVDGKPAMTNVGTMIAVAKAWSGVDMQDVARYFSALPARRSVTVIEAANVPKTYVNGATRLARPGNELEPLGNRIVELPKDVTLHLLRDPGPRTIAYVPPGSVARGEAAVESGAMPCSSCHGAQLKGMGETPPIAGRSPLYTFRQLHFFKDGSRAGATAETMRERVKGMTESNMIDVAAYLASLEP
jgi:cytochrome c553